MKKYLVSIFSISVMYACSMGKKPDDSSYNENKKVPEVIVVEDLKQVNDTVKDIIKEIQTAVDTIYIEEEYKFLYSLIKDNDEAMQKLILMSYKVLMADSIKTIDEVENIFAIREQLMQLLISDNNFDEWGSSSSFYSEDIDAELEKIGLRIATLAGDYQGVTTIEFLQEQINRVADEPYKILNEIKNIRESVADQDYYYLNPAGPSVVPLAERMLSDYPDHKYNEEIADYLKQALYSVTDIHRCLNCETEYIVGGFDVSRYPGGADILIQRKFVEANSDSRFAAITDKILGNISTITNPESTAFYIIEVPPLSNTVFVNDSLNKKMNTLPDYIKNKDDKFKYLWLGVDIAHKLYLKENGENKAILAYRFYDMKESAEKNLRVIQEVIPSAKVVVYSLK